jgi:hypothetical protein
VETRVRKLIYGAMPPQVKHPTLVERVSIRPYTRNDTFHMMLEMEYIMPMNLVPEMYYLMHCFQICLRIGLAPPMLATCIIECQFYVGNK